MSLLRSIERNREEATPTRSFLADLADRFEQLHELKRVFPVRIEVHLGQEVVAVVRVKSLDASEESAQRFLQLLRQPLDDIGVVPVRVVAPTPPLCYCVDERCDSTPSRRYLSCSLIQHVEPSSAIPSDRPQRRIAQPRFLVHPEHHVHALDSLSGSTLHQVVDGSEEGRPS